MMQEAKGYGRIQPNDALKQERQRRGWSRNYVAEQIGIADPKTLGRWERGVASPSAYFLQRLCSLFEMVPHELGLLQADSPSPFTPSLVCPSDDISSIFDPLIPPPHAETEGLVARDAVLQQLKEQLFKRGQTLIALYGLPGVGKTALAGELAYDSEIQQRFCDGILWAAPGPEANVLAHLERWGNLLDLPESEIEHPTTVEAWTCAIRAAIGMRHLLIIIDDAWTAESTFAFNIGGPNCSYIVTTRLPIVALHFANANALHLRPWNEEESLQLLACFAPTLVVQDEPAARRLVRAVGGLPLGVTIIGKYCRDHSYGGQQRRLRAALERLNSAEKRLRQEMYQVRSSLEHRGDELEPPLISIEMAIATSYQRLDERAQYMLAQLSVLPTGQDGFSEEAALAISAMTLETLDVLVDAGLLEVIGSSRYTLHPTIADYGRIQHNLTSARKRMVTYFVRYVEMYGMDKHALALEQQNIQEALCMAFTLNISTTALPEVMIFAAFLQERGDHELAAWYLQWIEQATRRSNKPGMWPVAVESQPLPAQKQRSTALMQAYKSFDNRLLAPATAQKRPLLTGPPSLS